MRFERMRDVFEHARNVHTQMGEYYHSLSEESHQDRIKLLLDYLSQHEQILEEHLSDYENIADNDLLNTYIDYSSSETTLKKINDIEITNDMSVDEVIQFAVSFDNCLIKFYQEIIDHTNSNPLKEALTNLLESEKREQMHLVINATMVKDL